MRYLEKEDIVEVIQERLLDESLQLDDNILTGLEEKAIAFATSYISGRYKTSEIFGDPILRHAVLVQAIAMIVVYRAVRRNAARKVPDDYTDIYKEAKEILKNIQSGAQTLDGLPEITSDSGSTAKLMYGNTTNDDFFI
ncbi:phage protein Gp36 family protein [Dysgonomonas sp. ZJ279]|uniref:phage protein Gp36 family protein n=1 Tax=Dysgonomonas sp. ZJ279 TaxID=2709796 RepID=UPI0013ED3DE5|nr:phage protein Gp36 family protein [Dysgonomonas sp. ZJ279]